MEFYAALVIPTILTVVVVVLSWLYTKKASRLVSEWSAGTGSKKTAADLYSNPAKEEEERPTKGDDDVFHDVSKLKAQVAPYLIDPGDIQEVSEHMPLDSKQIEQEIKEKGMENIQTFYKSSRLHIKEMEDMLTHQEREQERLAQRKQLEEIYKLMAQEKEKFGVESMDQIEDQMRLYDVQ